MAKTSAASQTKTAQVNTFTGGLNTDLHPLLQPADTLTDCVNGTVITYNGNENMLQNDMGNYELKNAKLPEGYIPMGIKEHQGVFYMILMNPITKKVQIGSYPSPQTIFEKGSKAEEYSISPADIGVLKCSELTPEELARNESAEAKFVWNLLDDPEHKDWQKYLYTALDLSESSTIFTKDFHDNSTLTLGDRYLLDKSLKEGETLNPPFQSLNYFITDSDKNITPLVEGDVDDESEWLQGPDDILDNTDGNKYNDVTWNKKGWLGARFEVETTDSIEQNIQGSLQGVSSKLAITGYRKTSDINKSLEGDEGHIVTYEFPIKGLNTKNSLYNLSDFLKNNTNTVYIKTDKSLYTDKEVTKGYWSGGCYLEGEYDTPFYKYENKEMYPSMFSETPDYTNFVSQQIENLAAVVVPQYVDDNWFKQFSPTNCQFIVYFTGDLEFWAQAAAKDVFCRNEGCTMIFADRCSEEFINAMKEPLLETQPNPVNFPDKTTFTGGVMTMDELNGLVLNKCRLYFNTDITNWGLHGTYTLAEWSTYQYAETDWAPAIRGLLTYATDVMYPTREDLIAVRTSTYNTIAYSLPIVVETRLPEKRSIAARSTLFVDTMDTPIETEVSQWSLGEYAENSAFEYHNIEHEKTIPNDKFPYWKGTSLDDILADAEDPKQINGWFINSSTIVQNNKWNPLFRYQFFEVDFQIRYALEPLNKWVTDINIVSDGGEYKIVLSVDLWGTVGINHRNPDLNALKLQMAEFYLFNAVSFNCSYYSWKIVDTAANLGKFVKYTISIPKVNKVGRQMGKNPPRPYLPSKIYSSFLEEFESEQKVVKVVVPDSFKGEIMGTKYTKPLDDYKVPTKWSELLRLSQYNLPNQTGDITGALQINIPHNDDVRIATKITYNQQSQYYDSSSGKIEYSFTVFGEEMPDILVESVPYKVDVDEHCLIYDNEKISTTINYFKNYESRISEYKYYKLNNTINVELSLETPTEMQTCFDSIKIYSLNNDMLQCNKHVSVVLPKTEDTEGDSEESSESSKEKALTYSNNLIFNIVSDIPIEEEFLFLHIDLDEDDSVILPLYTNINKNQYDAFVKNNVNDFTTLYIDQLKALGDEIPTELIEEDPNTGEKYITATYDDGELNILIESDLPYYWYNGLQDSNSQTDDTNTLIKQVCFGKAKKVNSKINLTGLGVREGDIITIKGIPNKEYNNITVTAKNSNLFEKIEDKIYLKLNMYSGYNLTSYRINPTKDTRIALRKYLIHHGHHPVTHRDEDLGWVKNSPLFEHTGWNTFKPELFKMLYVTKADAYNSNVTLNVIDNSSSAFNEESEEFERGPVVTNQSQVNEKIRDIVGNEDTKQLFTLIKATVDVNGSGLTLPVPKMTKGKYKFNWDKNKKNSGTEDAIVLTRASDGLMWVNQLKNVIAYATMGVGIAVLASAMASAISAAITAATVVAGTLSAIPFVGWAVLAAAVIAASIYLLCRVTAGEDQEFEFFAMKGPDKYPLVIPIWGSHPGKVNNSDKVKAEWKNTDGNAGPHPWYVDPNFVHSEELITYLMTHVYYHIPGPSITLGDAQYTVTQQNYGVELQLNSLSESLYDTRKYNSILGLISKTNNFTVQHINSRASFKYNLTPENVVNDFDIKSQKVSIYSADQKCYHDSNMANNWTHDSANKAEINAEMDTFINNLRFVRTGDIVNIYYGGPIRSEEQDAFGGNTGGKATKLKCNSTKGMKAMFTGEYPRNDQVYVPIAYGVEPNCGDKIMVKDLGWNEANSTWGTSVHTYRNADDTADEHGSKYYDYIIWDSYSDEFKLTVNTNEI